jgi:hypothetical protein
MAENKRAIRTPLGGAVLVDRDKDEIGKIDRFSKNLFFCVLTVMFYGGLTLCAFGIEGVAWYSGAALAAAVHGLLLSHREGCW